MKLNASRRLGSQRIEQRGVESGFMLTGDESVVARWAVIEEGQVLVFIEALTGSLIERVVLEAGADDFRVESDSDWSYALDGARLVRSLDARKDLGPMSRRASRAVKGVVDFEAFPELVETLDSLTWRGDP